MTFDARKTNHSSASGKQNALFAAITLIVVCGAFFAVLSLPAKPAPGPQADAAGLADVAAVPIPHLPGQGAEAYYAALGRVDAGAQAALARKLRKAGEVGDAARAELILAHGLDVVRAHADELAEADTRHLDHILELAQRRLRLAAGKRSKWCNATHYATLKEVELRDPAQLQQELSAFEAPMREFAFEALEGLMLAVEDAREHPVPRGAMTRADQAALNGFVMSVVTDPDVAPLMASVRRGDDPQNALKGVNVCNIASTAVIAAKTLPQETKGRLLAETMKQLKQSDPETLFRTVSF